LSGGVSLFVGDSSGLFLGVGAVLGGTATGIHALTSVVRAVRLSAGDSLPPSASR
jgi:hypothetical protein